MTEWNQTKKFISGGLLRDSMPWLTEEGMIAAFGPGGGPYQPEKGYSQEWHFIRPGSPGGFTVYFRWGRSSIGGNGSHEALNEFEAWLRDQLEPPPEEAKKCVESGVKSSRPGYNGDMRTTGKKKETTIDWLISFVGDRGGRHFGAPHADILSEGCKAGHSESTLRLYLHPASGCGHVKPWLIGDAPYTRRARRPVYFERVRRDEFVLSPLGKARYHQMNGDVSRPRVIVTHDTSGSMSKSELAAALAEVEEIPVIHITDGMKRVQAVDVLGLPTVVTGVTPPAWVKSALVEPVDLEINEESRVKSADPGYNGDMAPQLSDAVLSLLNSVAGEFYTTAFVDLEECDEGYSYEDTLYLTIETEYMPVRIITELAEELEVELDDVSINHDKGVTKVTFVNHLNEVKWWLKADPKGKAPHPGMEFEIPDNFSCSFF